MIDTKKDYQLQGYYNLVAGVNVNVSSLLMKANELLESKNLTSTKLGVLEIAPSKTQFGVTLVDNKPMLGGHVFLDSSGVAHKIGVINNAGGTQSVLYEIGASSNTSRKADFTASKEMDFITLLNYVFATNGTDDLATATDLSTWGTVHAVGAPKGRFIEEFNNEPYIFGNLTNKYVVYKGKLHNPAVEAIAYVSGDHASAVTAITCDSTKYLKAGQVIDIYTGGTLTKVFDSKTITSIDSDTQFTIGSTATALSDGDEIYLEDTRATNAIRILWNTEEDTFELPPNGEAMTGGAKCNNRLIIFQENSMHKWDGAVRAEISPNIGCSASKSIATVDSKYMFWMHKGSIYSYDGSYPQVISQKIQPILDSMTDYSKCVGIGDETNKRLFMYLGDISCSALTGTDVWAVYYIGQDKWEFITDIQAQISFKDKTGVNSETMYIGDEVGDIYKFMEGTSSSVAYSMKTKFDYQSRPESVKEYAYIITMSEMIGGELSYAIDGEDNYTSLGEITDKVQTFTLPMGVKGHNISIMWSGHQSGSNSSLMGYSILYKEVGIE